MSSTTSTSKTLKPAAIPRHTLSSDLQTLLALPPTTLASLRTSGTPPLPTSTPSALEALDAYPSNTTEADISQGLIKAYIGDMRGVVRNLGQSEEERKLGERIDRVRAQGEGIKDALGEVKL